MTLDLAASLSTSPHRRWNPLRGDWVIVSPQRTQRPWQGQVEAVAEPVIATYDATCYLCPGNERAGGHKNPAYTSTFVFENDYAALRPVETPFVYDPGDKGLIVARSESGLCRVLCFSPRHDLTLAKMDVTAIRAVVDEWDRQVLELGARPEINYVEIFENRGAMMGASNPHPHGQIWATASIPNEPLLEQNQQLKYFSANQRTLLSDYLEIELQIEERIVLENAHFIALVPHWATWPFEVLVLPRRAVAGVDQLTDTERDHLAAMLQGVTRTYDKVFDVSFPYSMGLHGRPVDGEQHAEWHFHLHFYPPLLRSATVRKFMVGFELLGSPQRDITPESAAETLRKARNAWQ
jgi:UDPglucose--hexose-1-phosphate uridylyltransferase